MINNNNTNNNLRYYNVTLQRASGRSGREKQLLNPDGYVCAATAAGPARDTPMLFPCPVFGTRLLPKTAAAAAAAAKAINFNLPALRVRSSARLFFLILFRRVFKRCLSIFPFFFFPRLHLPTYAVSAGFRDALRFPEIVTVRWSPPLLFA